jgi:hypothetical protein
MKKSLIACFVVLVFLIQISRAATCDPTISWVIDSQFFTGETSKLVATIRNACDTTFNVKTEVNTEKTYGYIKVYSVSSEDQKPMPKAHSVNVGSTMAYLEIGKTGTDDSQKKVVYFIQPDELALPGTYTLYENFYVEDVLKQSKEIQITVKKPLQLTYRIPNSIRIDKPSDASININNLGTEILSSLKICLSSVDNVVSFSESCKTWTNIPSKFADTFNLILNGVVPGSYQNEIKVKTDYTTYTGLTVSDSYDYPSLMITTTQAGIPSLSYSFTRGIRYMVLKMYNKGNTTAYDCFVTISSPINCVLNSINLTSSTKIDNNNVYGIKCGYLIPVKGSSEITLFFEPTEISPSCLITGTISYKDGTGKPFGTKISEFFIKQPIITPPKTDQKKMTTLYIIILVAIVIDIFAFLIFLKYKKPETYAKVVQPFKKILERIIPKSNKTEVDKKE